MEDADPFLLRAAINDLRDVVRAFTADGKFEMTPAAVPESLRDENGYLAVLPHLHGTDGFFAAVLKRVG